MRLEKQCWRCETLNEADADRCVVCNEWIGDPLAHSMDILRLALQEGWMEQTVFVEKVRKEFGPSVEPYLSAFYEMMRNMLEAKGRMGGVVPSVEKVAAINLGRGVTMDLVWVEPGRFRMGSEHGEDDERPVHEVQITKGFWVGKTPVTQAQWERVMGYNPSHFKGTKNPVERVSWNDSQQFIMTLNHLISGGGFSLPTEAQWEYACRAGSTGAFCFGDDESRMGEYAWCDENSGDTPHPVGEKKPNAWGLYDMHGNVWEWCQDWYGKYLSDVQTDPTGAVSGSLRVKRGGSWYFSASCCRSAFRSNSPPVSQDYLNGFRLVGNLP